MVNTNYIGSIITVSGQNIPTQSNLVINTFTDQQENQYGGYNPDTDWANSPWAKLSREIGLDKLQGTFSDPNASWQDKVGAVAQFLGTNINNIIQLGLILGGPEEEGVAAAGEEGAGLLSRVGEEGGLVNKVADETSTAAFPTDPSQLDHIFRVDRGHFPENTPEARQAIMDTINGSSRVGTDKFGSQWYIRDLPNGQQIYVSVRNGIIQNAGINSVPRIWDVIHQRLVER